MNCQLLAILLLVCALTNVQGRYYNYKKRPPCIGKYCGGYNSYYGAGGLGAGGYMYGQGAGTGAGAYLGGSAYMAGGLDGGAGLMAGGLDGGAGLMAGGLAGGAGLMAGGVGNMGMAGASGYYSGGMGGASMGFAPGIGGAGYFPGGSAMGGRWIRRGFYYFPFPWYCPRPSVPIFKINKRWWYCRIWYYKKY